ncbi:NYN domain-containing protein [Agrobacterium tumefaciens]|uniref:NYN domain-containing protein n=1 Tax=Agrobacterium tumefaciens TaxID=358 RepID=UPI00287BE4E5|nr:NYN domain-containing protein [Agrobacterium tumefaciens]MDS7594929.1 NYN domain-containing protein [Agrobacterium tumefaciens]
MADAMTRRKVQVSADGRARIRQHRAAPTPVLAVLIDGDNVSSKIADELFGAIEGLGTAAVRRIYGDWTKASHRGWKSKLADHAIQPVQQFATLSGKNATDFAMIIDAMDLLHRGRFDGFCLATSDSDFTRLAVRIREEGVAVHGFGARHTPRSLIAACSSFTQFDQIRPSVERQSLWPVPALAIGMPDRILEMIEAAVVATADDDGWATLARVGLYLALHEPGFDMRHYGFTKLSRLADACPVLDVRRTGDAVEHIGVRLRQDRTLLRSNGAGHGA